MYFRKKRMTSDRIKAVTCYLCIAILVFFLTGSRVMARVIIKPSLGASVTYDDNIVFTHYKPVSDWIYEIHPAVEIDYEDPKNTVNLITTGQGQHYNTENELDTFDVDVNLRAERQHTERLNFAITGRYARDTTLDQTLLEAGQFLRRENRQLYTVSPEVTWMINEKSSISASLPWVKVNYDRESSVDYDTLYFYLTYSYLLPDQKTRLFIRPDIGRMNYDTGDYRTADFMCGLERDFTERLYARVLGGFNYTDSDTDIKVVDHIIMLPDGSYYYTLKDKKQNKHYWGWVAEAELKWRLDRGNIDATFTRRVSASGYGEPVISTYFTPSVSWRFTERLRGRVSGGISEIKSHNLTYDQHYWTYAARPSLVYRLTRYIDAGIHYTYQYIDDHEHDNNNRDRNRVIFRLDIRDFNLHLTY